MNRFALPDESARRWGCDHVSLDGATCHRCQSNICESCFESDLEWRWCSRCSTYHCSDHSGEMVKCWGCDDFVCAPCVELHGALCGNPMSDGCVHRVEPWKVQREFLDEIFGKFSGGGAVPQ